MCFSIDINTDSSFHFVAWTNKCFCFLFAYLCCTHWNFNENSMCCHKQFCECVSELLYVLNCRAFVHHSMECVKIAMCISNKVLRMKYEVWNACVCGKVVSWEKLNFRCLKCRAWYNKFSIVVGCFFPLFWVTHQNYYDVVVVKMILIWHNKKRRMKK